MSIWELVNTIKLPGSSLPTPVNRQPSAIDEFTRSLEDLSRAIARNRNASKLLEEFKNKGSLSSLLHTFTGRNDKELAEMVEDLGASLSTTQSVLRVLIQLQNKKSERLRDFHQALVDKIAAIKKDGKTLEKNQEEAAVFILEEISLQVREQIELGETVQLHTTQIEHIAKRLDESKEDTDRHLSKHRSSLDELDAALEAARQESREQDRAAEAAMHTQEKRINRQLGLQQQRLAELATDLQALTRASIEQEHMLARLHASVEGHSKQLETLSAEAAAAREAHAASIAVLTAGQSEGEQGIGQLRSELEAFRQRQSFLRTQALPVLAFISAAGALAIRIYFH